MSLISSLILENGQVLSCEEEKKAQISMAIGQGFFDPTDLLSASLAGCILITMSLMAKKDKEDLSGTKVDIEKELFDNPRRVGRLTITVTFRETIEKTKRERYLKAIHACPVHRSLHPDIEIILNEL